MRPRRSSAVMLSRRGFLQFAGGLPIALAGCSAGRPRAASPAAAAPAGRFPSLANFCDGVPAITAAENEARQERARGLLRDAGFAALLVEAGPSLQYFTGGAWWRSERPLLLILPVSGAPLFIVPAFEEGTARESVVGRGDLRVWQEHEDPYALTINGLRERGISDGRVAVEPSTRLFITAGLTRAGQRLSFENGAAVVDACRIAKSEAELAILRRANQATKAALRAAAAHAATGMTEDDLAELVREAQETAGLGSVWTLVAFGPNAAFPHGTSNRRPLAAGDLILVDTGGDLHGYRSDISRTWAGAGPVPAEVRRAFDAVLRAQTAAMKLIRPGTPCADVDAAARREIAAAGFGADYDRFTHRLGHGIGLEGHEPPYLVRGNGTILAPRMTMSNEPGIYVRGRYGIRIEDIVAVTDGEPEVFGPVVRSLDAPFGD